MERQQPGPVATLLAHTEAKPNHEQGRALREAILLEENADVIRLLVPVTDLEAERRHCANRGDWASLDRLSSFVPLDVAIAWSQRHRNLPEAHARQRQATALDTPPPATTRARLRRRS